LCNAELQHSELCIVDGTFAWQTVQRRGCSSREPSFCPAAAETAVVPQVDHHSAEDAFLEQEAVLADGARPTLINVNLTVPKVSFFIQIFLLNIDFTELLSAVTLLVE